MAEEEEVELGHTVHVRLGGTRSFSRPGSGSGPAAQPSQPERAGSGRVLRPQRPASGAFARPSQSPHPERTATGTFLRPPQARLGRPAPGGALDALSQLVLVLCGATMLAGVVIAGRSVLGPEPPPLSKPAPPREAGPLRFDYQGAGVSVGAPGAPAEEEGGPPPTFYEGPLIKDPDGRWYVARTTEDLGDRFHFDPRRVIRLVLKGESRLGQAAQYYVLFPGNVLVKGHAELLTLVDLGIKQRSTYSQHTGRGAVGEPARPTRREEEEARTARRLERQRLTGEQYGIDYTDETEFAPPVRSIPAARRRPDLSPAGQEEPTPPPARREWTDEQGVVRATAPPEPSPAAVEPPRDD